MFDVGKDGHDLTGVPNNLCSQNKTLGYLLGGSQTSNFVLIGL